MKAANIWLVAEPPDLSCIRDVLSIPHSWRHPGMQETTGTVRFNMRFTFWTVDELP